MHTHLLPERLPDFAEKFGYGDFIHLVHHKQGFARMMKGGVFFREISSNCWDPQVRIGEYLHFNTPVQVVCTIPVMFSYWAKPADCLDLSMYLNDHLGGVVEDFPEHYMALGTIPMQDTDLAIRELERLKQLGFPGIQIGSNVNRQNLGEPQFFPIFEACEQLDMAVFIHPWEMMGEADMRKYWLPWLVGMPAETSRAACSLIFSGVLERLPKLRFCFAHAGGSFIPTIGRIQHGFDCRPDLVAVDNNVPPRHYLGKFWWIQPRTTHNCCAIFWMSWVMKRCVSARIILSRWGTWKLAVLSNKWAFRRKRWSGYFIRIRWSGCTEVEFWNFGMRIKLDFTYIFRLTTRTSQKF